MWPPRAEAENEAEARRDTFPNANATYPSAMAKDLYDGIENHEKRGAQAAAFVPSSETQTTIQVNRELDLK